MVVVPRMLVELSIVMVTEAFAAVNGLVVGPQDKQRMNVQAKKVTADQIFLFMGMVSGNS